MSDDEYSDEFNSEEEFDFDDIEDGKSNVAGKEIPKRSPPIMWEYEKANIITQRKMAIDTGSPTLLDNVGDLVLSYDIALKEFNEGKIEYRLFRYIGKNFEVWKHEDFLYFPN
jgi:DNA-directed RNA polymerase subunit K/omega